MVFTPQEQQFYDDLKWLVDHIKAMTTFQPEVIKEVTKRADRMRNTFHEQGFKYSINID